jgi:hypothetical protein
MEALAHALLARLSRRVNHLMGGAKGQTLCARIALARGTTCLFCRVVGWFTEPDHCEREIADV